MQFLKGDIQEGILKAAEEVFLEILLSDETF